MKKYVRGFIEYKREEKVFLSHEVDVAVLHDVLATLVQFSDAVEVPKKLSKQLGEIRSIWSSDGFSTSCLEPPVVLQLREICTGENAKLIGSVIDKMQEIVKINQKNCPRFVFWFEKED